MTLNVVIRKKRNLKQVTVFLVLLCTFIQPAGWREDGHGVAVLWKHLALVPANSCR